MDLKRGNFQLEEKMVDICLSAADLQSDYCKMFLEKMAILNRTFLDVLQGQVREVPDADLSPTVRDYLEHVKNLDRIYGSRVPDSLQGAPSSFAFGSNATQTAANSTLSGEFCSCAHLESKPYLKASPSSSSIIITGAINSSPLSVTAQTSDASQTKSTFSLTTTPRVSFGNWSSSETNSDTASNERRGMKRAKRGGPDERADEVLITYQAPPTQEAPASVNASTKPAATFSFGKQQSDEKQSSEGSTPKKSLFAFGLASKEDFKQGDSSDQAETAKNVDKETPKEDSSNIVKDAPKANPPCFTFGTSQKAPASSGFSFGLAGNGDLKPSAAPLFTFGKTTTKDSTKKDSNETAAPFKAPTFPSIGSLSDGAGKDVKPLFSFGMPAKDSSSTEKTSAAAAVAGFKFGPPPATSGSSQSDKDVAVDARTETLVDGWRRGENDEEYVPPKVEAVLEEEPNAIFSSKFVVFVFPLPVSVLRACFEGENDEEYVPPKVEAVLEEEPDAIFSSKFVVFVFPLPVSCSVFILKGKTYEKLGIGQLHIKKAEKDEKKILLVRAATTIDRIFSGTIWLNVFVDKNLQVAKADEVKLRVREIFLFSITLVNPFRLYRIFSGTIWLNVFVDKNLQVAKADEVKLRVREIFLFSITLVNPFRLYRTFSGTIWLNVFVDKNLQVAKADEVKLRVREIFLFSITLVSSVSGGHPATHLIRLPSAKDRERVEKELSDGGAGA
uniref:RanBD1 domain-containing protein n=1 Tax=Ascaris lumbricoides TaxID=6252 RepID=A0A0M3IBW0_ASCLU